MIDWFASGGFFMWLVLGAGLVSIGLAADAGRRLLGTSGDEAAIRSEIDAVLFWGGFAALLGLIGTLGGVGVMARSIEQAGSVSPAVAWSGIRVALITTVFGLMVLAVTLLAWFGLRTGLRRSAGGG